uniref:Neurotransmitter-gated ion-channel ligand-binding domain-containing protein n=1 Tax=Cuerna arida TaxID=1464854 RepID=A0A1B6G1R0_9HEMI
MHYFSTVLLLSAGVSFINSHEIETTTPPPCNDKMKTNVGRLKKAVFCGYDSSVRPVLHHSNKTFIKLSAFPTNINWIMEENNQIWMAFWFFMQWKDELLTWNISDYEGLEEFYADASSIWVPDIYVSDPPQSYSMGKQMKCLVHSNGDVECTMSTSVLARCDIDLTYFPFDRHSCKLVLRPRSYHGPVLNLDFMDTSGTDPLKLYRPNGAWNLMSVKFNRNVTNIKGDIYTTDIECSFVLERRSSSYNVTYATPALVMMIMVLCVFWLDVQCSARVILPALAVLGHLIIIEWLMRAIDSNFDHLPVIILLFRDSLLITGLALVWSVISRSLCTSSTSPYWLYMVSTNLNSNHIVKFLLPHDIFIKSGTSGAEDESTLTIHRDCVEQHWRILTTLIDRLMFAFSLLAYMYFFMRLTP